MRINFKKVYPDYVLVYILLYLVQFMAFLMGQVS